jgi:amino acid adenylation domain-containing protein
MQATSTTWRLLIEAGWQGDQRLKILCGGEALPRELARQLVRRCSSLWNMYGPTETTIWSLVHKIENQDDPILIGHPIGNTQVYVLDPAFQLLPAGVPGELYIAGAGLARGYLNRPELTKEKFVPNPFSLEDQGNRGIGDKGRLLEQNSPYPLMYRTGDLVRWRSNGKLEFLGRIDFQVKVRGFRIELGEIEAVLGRHPVVAEAVVVVREDTPGDRRLVAYLELRENLSHEVRTENPPIVDRSVARDLVVKELRDLCRKQLPDYMNPSVFVVLESLPLTPNNKVDRRALAALPAPDLTLQEAALDFSPPLSPEEQLIAGLWAQVLRVHPSGISRDANFFELGGHSLLATQVVSRLRDAFHIVLPLLTIFETESLAAFAAQVVAARQAEQGVSTPAMVHISPDGSFPTGLPLSYAQQRLWFLDQLQPGTALYNMPVAVRLDGPLDCSILERCLNEIVRRHASLRTTFPVNQAGRVEQSIASELIVPLPVIDLQDVSEPEREAEAVRRAVEEARHPFDLAAEPLVRAFIFRIGPEQHFALLNVHHIVCDDWSLGIFIEEMATLYAAYSLGDPSPLPDLPVQYPDYTVWQQAWMERGELQIQMEYWKEKLAGIPPLLALPTDRPRPAVQSFRGAKEVFYLPAELTETVYSFSQSEGATVFMTLLAVFQILLHRYTGQEEVCVGTPIANRVRSELEGLIGFFANTIVLRGQLSGELSFRDLLHQVRVTAIEAYAHQELPFELLVEALQPERDLSHSPLFQVMMVLQNAPQRDVELSQELCLCPVDLEEETARFDLTLSLEEDAGQFKCTFVYNRDLFEAATIQRMAGHFQTLVAQAIGDPVRLVSQIQFMTGPELHELLVARNSTAFPYPEYPIHRWFEVVAAAQPDTPAIVFEDQILTYAELNRRANQLAHYLVKIGVEAERPVALCLDRSPELILGLLGILKAGGAYVPIDPAYPVERKAYLLEEISRPFKGCILLTQEKPIQGAQTPLSATAGLPENIHTIDLASLWSEIAGEPAENLRTDVSPEQLAYIIFTSGSTGKPKGVMLQHGGLVNLVQAQTRCLEMRPGDLVLQFASISFDASLSEIFMALATGATLLLAPTETLTSPIDLLDLLREKSVTVVTLPPSLLQVLPAHDLPDLRALISAGESCPLEVAERWAPGRLFFNGYGPTETTVGPTFHRVDLEKLHQSGAATVPIGRPLQNIQIYLLDSNQQPVPIGVPGEIYVGGVGVARGYLNQPELTAENFVANPLSSVDQVNRGIGDKGILAEQVSPIPLFYRTGDLARWLSDGNLEFLGRVDQQIKLRGFRIELGEIEAVLGAHPAVEFCAVVSRGDQPENKQLVAYYKPAPGFELDTATTIDLRAHLAEKLPEYMLPAFLIRMDQLPVTANGKIDRHALAALPLPYINETNRAQAYAPPRNAVEKVIADMLAAALSINRVGIYDNFFELGGHSLLATQLILQIQQTLSVEIQLRSLFENPSVAGVAGKILANPLQANRIERTAELVLKVAQLSDEQVANILKSKRS